METIFADRISDVPKSFIREILKVAIDDNIISFAGGLPNRDYFPVQAIQRISNALLTTNGHEILQYSTTEGYLPLRTWIADRYKSDAGITVDPSQILITSGSQQGLDLIGKVLLNEGDGVVIEAPGYIGAIQSLSMYKPQFHSVQVDANGMDTNELRNYVSDSHAKQPKIMYCVPNYQNPTGIRYSLSNRQEVASVLRHSSTILIEDDPYGEIRFQGERPKSFWNMLPDRTILLGSFSKTVAPSLRIAWMVLPENLYDKFTLAKQAADLHSNYFAQRIIYDFVSGNEYEQHLNKIRYAYGQQCNAMMESVQQYFPNSVKSTTPEGGMFLWLTLDDHVSSMDFFDKAIAAGVAFVPGEPFYVEKPQKHTLRLNFSCYDEASIRTGIKKLAQVYRSVM